MQTLSFTKPAGLALSARSATGARPARARSVVVVAAKKGRSGPMGYVEQDNSGRANIFAVEPKQLYTSSPTSDRAARTGLGGSQGLALVGGVIGVVLLVTLGLARAPEEMTAFSGSLSDIAAQFAAGN